MPLRCPDRHRARIGSWESARPRAATWRCRLPFAPRFDHHRRTVVTTLRRSYLCIHYCGLAVLTSTNHPAAVTGAALLVILAVCACIPTALSPSRHARHRHRQPQPQPQRFALDTHCGYAHVIRGGPAGALLRMHLSTSPPCDSASALRFPTPAAPIRLPSATSHANGKHVGFLVLRLPPPNHSAHA